MVVEKAFARRLPWSGWSRVEAASAAAGNRAASSRSSPSAWESRATDGRRTCATGERGSAGEITSIDIGAWLNWSALTAAEPDAQPDRYFVKLRPDSNPDGYAAAVQAQEPDFLTVAINRVTSDSDIDAMNAIMRVLALVLGLIAAVGVFSIMLLHVRERSRDIAILKAVGMSPGQLLVMVMTSSAVLGVIGGLVGMPAGVRIHHGLVTQVGKAIGNTPPPLAFDVLHPMTLYPLGLTGLAIALAGAFLPARRAARSRVAETLRSE